VFGKCPGSRGRSSSPRPTGHSASPSPGLTFEDRALQPDHSPSVINAIRAHLAEFGVIAPVGRKGIEELLRVIADRLNAAARPGRR